MNNRNSPCHCGSGIKYKKCHLQFDTYHAWALKLDKYYIQALAYREAMKQLADQKTAELRKLTEQETSVIVDEPRISGSDATKTTETNGEVS